MAGIKRQEVTIGERAKGVVREKNASHKARRISRKGAKEAKVAEKEAHPDLPREGDPCEASAIQEVIINYLQDKRQTTNNKLSSWFRTISRKKKREQHQHTPPVEGNCKP
jgi:hypothetical protein